MMQRDYRTARIAGAPNQLARELALWLGGKDPGVNYLTNFHACLQRDSMAYNWNFNLRQGPKGMQVHVAARAPEELEPYLARARDSGARLLPVELDTTRVEEARERVLALDEACGGLDLVVAAGTYGVYDRLEK